MAESIAQFFIDLLGDKVLNITDLGINIAAGISDQQVNTKLICLFLCSVYNVLNEHIGIIF